MYLQEESEGEEFEGGAGDDDDDEIDEADGESGEGVYKTSQYQKFMSLNQLCEY